MHLERARSGPFVFVEMCPRMGIDTVLLELRGVSVCVCECAYASREYSEQ
jgi:hypothetical protein